MTSTPAVTPSLRQLAEAADTSLPGIEGRWYNAAFLGAFIDEDDEQVMTAEDCDFIAAASPSVVLALIEERDRLARIAEAAKAVCAVWLGLPFEEPDDDPDGTTFTARAERAEQALIDAVAALRDREGEGTP